MRIYPYFFLYFSFILIRVKYISFNEKEVYVMKTYIIYEFSKNREEVIAKHVITGVTSFESAKKAAAFMAGRELGFCITEEH